MADKTVSMILPGLLPSILREYSLELPFLSKILSKASLHNQTTLFPSIDHSGGTLEAYAQSLVAEPNEVWSRVHFLECHFDHRTVFVTRELQDSLEPAEIDALRATFEPFFEESGLSLHITDSGHWLVRHHQAPDVSLTNVYSLMGKSLWPYLPLGNDGTFWKRLLTECQMILSNHPVNLSRQDNQRPIIASMWFDGSGAMPEKCLMLYSKIYTDEPSIVGLAKWLNISSVDVMTAFEPEDEDIAVISRQFYKWLKQGDHLSLINSLTQWEKHWFKPLYQAIFSNKLHEIVIDDGSGHHYSLKPAHRFYLWRANRHFSNFCQDY